jgi:hypothetical protein
MIALRHLLAPSPRHFTADRLALAAVAALAAAATPAVIDALFEVKSELRGSALAAMWVVGVTAWMSVVLARRALAATSTVRARTWLVAGGALAGMVDVTTSYTGVVLLRGGAHLEHLPLGEVLLGSLTLGGTLGGLFGVACAPVVTAAVRARLTPSIDAADRVLFAAGASLVGVGALAKVASPDLPGLALVVLAGALIATLASARLFARVRLLRRARAGAEPGFHLVPRSDREDESGLVPLVRASAAPGGVLAATGISAPYRGARGVFKLALAPLADEPLGRPILGMLGGALGEVGHAMTAVVVGAIGMWMVGMVVFAFMVGLSATLMQR